ncbi:MAG: hypothetical protein SLAVMIC_00056 [uncultured marine phage]|uniref:SHOCT domain-containing protein n=1 Tax=uncultured marine phage TaxID=707152 RepID=A0A8D9FQF2_9VIRU|nr:MAG: hypothetical protein SLAVMIC_00056 [uncultured marine phage]
MNKPNAWIVASKDRGRKKIYRGKETGNRRVYLTDGDEFQIELHNPTTSTVMAKIWMDGKSISNSGIIVRPGQRIYLERYLDEDRSFKFETYDVENTSGNRKAISSNGKLEVKFYNEQINYNNNNGTVFIGNNEWWNGTFYGTCGTFTTNSAGNFGIYSDGTTTTNIGGSMMNVSSTPTAYTQNFNVETQSLSAPLTKGVKTRSSKENLETGQVAKGEKTGQNLKHIDMDFESYPTSTVTYWLMPESRKILTKNDLKKKQYFNDGASYFTKEELNENNPTHQFTEAEKVNLLFNALTQLKQLQNDGLITHDEFMKKREKLMKENS